METQAARTGARLGAVTKGYRKSEVAAPDSLLPCLQDLKKLLV
jgi:hypothetical protein